LLPLTLTVIVAVPDRFATGVIDSVRVDPDPETDRFPALFGTKALLEVAVTFATVPATLN
jgi:hypothetical protein